MHPRLTQFVISGEWLRAALRNGPNCHNLFRFSNLRLGHRCLLASAAVVGTTKTGAVKTGYLTSENPICRTTTTAVGVMSKRKRTTDSFAGSNPGAAAANAASGIETL